MKAEHRHELKTNELAEWIANFPEWAKQNMRTIIITAAVAVFLIGYYIFYHYYMGVQSEKQQVAFTATLGQLPGMKLNIIESQQKGYDISERLSKLADGLGSTGQNASSEDMAALALIKDAEVIRTEIHYRAGSVNEQDLIKQTNAAKDIYAGAMKKEGASPALKAAAKLGFGLCDEDLGNFESAKKTYNEIVADGAFKGTVAAAQADMRLKTMDSYKEKIVFRPAPKAPPEQVLQPLVGVKSPEANIPVVNVPAVNVPVVNVPAVPPVNAPAPK